MSLYLGLGCLFHSELHWVMHSNADFHGGGDIKFIILYFFLPLDDLFGFTNLVTDNVKRPKKVVLG